MSEFSITNLATEGFRITRENPIAVVFWSVLQIILQFAMAIAMVRSGFLAQVQAITASSAPDPAGLIEAFEPLQAQMAWFLPLSVLIQIMLRAAILRVILRPSETSPGYLRLGADELRLFALQIIFGLMAFAFMVLLIGATTVFAQAGGLGVLLATAAIVGGLCAAIFVMVRFSLASSQTFATRRLNLLGSWKLTQGRFWPLLGCYLLALVFYIAVVLLGSILGGVFSMIGGGDAGDASTLSTYFTVTNIISIVVQGIIAALGTVLLFAPPVVAYKTLTQRPEVDVF